MISFFFVKGKVGCGGVVVARLRKGYKLPDWAMGGR